MESNLTNLSYESFELDLQKKASEEKVVVSSTMMVKVGREEERLRGIASSDEKTTAASTRGKRKLILPPLPYRCRECGREFSELQNIRNHFVEHLMKDAFQGSSKDNNPKFECRLEGCDREFINADEREKHEIRHAIKGHSNCERIQRKFKYKYK